MMLAVTIVQTILLIGGGILTAAWGQVITELANP